MRLRIVAFTITCLVAVGLVLTTPVASEAARSLRVSRTQAISGETVTISGSTGVAVVRTVQLQRQSGTSWVTLATAQTRRNGTFSFPYRAPWVAGIDTNLRVKAPRVRLGSRTYPTAVAGTQTVRTIPQTAASHVPSTVQAGAPADVAGTFTPARPGRPTRVQQWNGSHWATVSSGTEDNAGQTVFSVAIPDPGSATLRTVADSDEGVSASVSEAARLSVVDTTVTADPTPTDPTPTATPVPDPKPAPSCGPAVTKADGTPWTCTFADEFDGTKLDTSAWAPQTQFATGVPGSFACYRNDPDTIAVAGGSLNLTVHQVDVPVSCSFANLSGQTNLVAGSVMSYQRFSQQFGRFEVRMKTSDSKVQGLHEAFWLWPDDRYPSADDWPVSGEIDVSESYSSYTMYSIPYLHYSADDGPQNGVNTAYCAAERGVWNTYTLDWSAGRIEIDVNGKTCLVNTSGSAAFIKPYIMALTSGIGGDGDKYDGRAPLPATTSIDYVHVWK